MIDLCTFWCSYFSRFLSTNVWVTFLEVLLVYLFGSFLNVTAFLCEILKKERGMIYLSSFVIKIFWWQVVKPPSDDKIFLSLLFFFFCFWRYNSDLLVFSFLFLIDGMTSYKAEIKSDFHLTKTVKVENRFRSQNEWLVFSTH